MTKIYIGESFQVKFRVGLKLFNSLIMVQESRNCNFFQRSERLHVKIVYSSNKETEQWTLVNPFKQTRSYFKLNYEELETGPVKLCIW